MDQKTLETQTKEMSAKWKELVELDTKIYTQLEEKIKQISDLKLQNEMIDLLRQLEKIKIQENNILFTGIVDLEQYFFNKKIE